MDFGVITRTVDDITSKDAMALRSAKEGLREPPLYIFYHLTLPPPHCAIV